MITKKITSELDDNQKAQLVFEVQKGSEYVSSAQELGFVDDFESNWDFYKVY